jgi:hypothetical protein
LLNKLGRKKWNVCIQARYDHGQGVAIYLARYVRGGPMSNRRLLEADEAQVTFRYHDYRDGQDKPMTLPTHQFLQRLLWHVPELGAHRIRSYGLYYPAKGEALTQCRQQLGQAPIEPPQYLDWQIYCQDLGQVESTQCPVCGKRLVCTKAFPPGGVPPPLEEAYAEVA